MRSVVVVLPASMWAMIPMFRTRSSAIACCVPATESIPPLPAIVREGLVGLRHPVDVVLLLERAALLVDRVEDLADELGLHPLLAPVARVLDEPANGERPGAALRHLDRHLVVRTTDAAGAGLEHRRDGLDGLLERFDRRLSGLLADLGQRAVDDLLGERLLAVEHHLVDHLGDERALVDGVGLDGPCLHFGTAWHYEPRFAPYLERPCLRSETPDVSRAARITLYRKPGRSLTRPPRI